MADPVDDAPAAPSPAQAHGQGRLPPGKGTPAWAKLWSLTILANLLAFIGTVWAARLLRAVPATDELEMALRAGYYGLMGLAAVADAFLADELLFRGAFRKTHLQGRDPRWARADADPAELAVTMQRSSISFPFSLLASFLLTYNLCNVLNGDFDPYYRHVGRYVSALRGDAREQRVRRLAAISALSIRRDPGVMQTLVAQLDRGGETAAWSAWALGRHYDLPRRRPLWGPLVAAAREPDPALRREALVALGRLQHRASAPQLLEEVRASMAAAVGPINVDPRLLYALGAVQVLDSLPVLEDLLHRGDPETQRLAAWTIAQHRDQRSGRAAVRLLEDRLPTAPIGTRCAVVHALGILADEASNQALMSAYDRASPEERGTICPRLQIAMRPDRLDDRIDLLMPQDTFARKVLASMGSMRATTPGVRARVEPWLTAVAADEAAAPIVRESATSLLQGIQQARDDTQPKGGPPAG